MTAPLRIAAVGLWHVHASDYAGAAQRHPDTELVAIWDDDPARGAEASDRLDTPVTDDLDALLARDDVDGITVTTSTNVHHDVISRALDAGKHVFTEKILAPTVDESLDLIARADRDGRMLEVSLPRLYDPSTLAVVRELDSGTLGEVTATRVRLAHDGWVSGWLPERFADPVEAIGGALTDLGCHPVYLTNLFHGAVPRTVSSAYGHVTGRAVDDTAVVTGEFADGSISTVEASLASAPGGFSIEVVGTRGTLVFDEKRMLGLGAPYDGETELALPAADTAPFDRWVAAIRSGVPDRANLDAAVDLTRVVVAANTSAAEHRSVAP